MNDSYIATAFRCSIRFGPIIRYTVL